MSTLHPSHLALGTIAHAELWQSIYTGMGAVPSPHTTPSPHGDISHSCIYYIRGLGTTGLQSRYHHYSLGDWLVLWSPCRVLMPYKVFYLEFENLYVDIRFVCYIYLKCKSCRYHLRDCSAESNLIIIKNVAKQNYNYPQPDILYRAEQSQGRSQQQILILISGFIFRSDALKWFWSELNMVIKTGCLQNLHNKYERYWAQRFW